MREQGHKLLARLGKTRLRPGGVEATGWILDPAFFAPGAQVLEVACNMGTTLIDLAQRYPNCTFTGIDLDDEALEQAQVNAAEAGVSDRIIFLHADARELPFEDNTFDVVINEAMLTMLRASDKPVAVAEYERVLKPGGVLLTHDVVQLAEVPEIVKRMQKAINVSAVPLSPEGWRELFEGAGFVDLEIKSGPMSLLSDEGLIRDEGEERTKMIFDNAEVDPNKEQFVEMREFFNGVRENLHYIAIKSYKHS